YDVISDHAWLQGDFISTVQKRGAAIIKARKLSSAASAANAIIDSVVSIRTATESGDNAALAVVSKGEYGVPAGLQFGFPIKSSGDAWEVIQGFELDEFAKSKIKITTDELLGERSDVAELIK